MIRTRRLDGRVIYECLWSHSNKTIKNEVKVVNDRIITSYGRTNVICKTLVENQLHLKRSQRVSFLSDISRLKGYIHMLHITFN